VQNIKNHIDHLIPLTLVFFNLAVVTDKVGEEIKINDNHNAPATKIIVATNFFRSMHLAKIFSKDAALF